MKIILASGSPRRKELLDLMKLNYEVIISDVNENMSQKLSYKNLAKNLSYIKAEDVFNKTNGERLIIGADSMVVFGSKIYGKPKNEDDAYNMLKSLSNKWHKVITGLSVIIEKNNEIKKYSTFEVTKVKFCKLNNDMIKKYLSFNEYNDKAGAYAIQGYFGTFVEKINGNYFNVVGLPINKLFKILHKEHLI